MTCCPHEAPPGVKLAPGRYCLAVCYCRLCPHWAPAPPPRYAEVRKAARMRAHEPWENDLWRDLL